MSEGKRDYFQIFLMVASLALAVLVVLLARENRQLKAQLADAHREIPADALQVGESVGPVNLLDDAGADVVVGFEENGPRTLLLLFSTQCPACEQTLPIWAEELPPFRDLPGTRMIAVQLDRSTDEEEAGSLLPEAYPFPIYAVPEGGLGEQLSRIPYIPAAVVLDPAGTVTGTWYGIPEESDLEELRTALGPVPG